AAAHAAEDLDRAPRDDDVLADLVVAVDEERGGLARLRDEREHGDPSERGGGDRHEHDARSPNGLRRHQIMWRPLACLRYPAISQPSSMTSRASTPRIAPAGRLDSSRRLRERVQQTMKTLSVEFSIQPIANRPMQRAGLSICTADP